MLNITRRDVEDAIRFAGSTQRSLSPYREHGEYLAGTVACQAESGLAAFGYGLLEGRYGPIKVGPVHLDLLAGLGLHAAGFLGVAGKHAGHVHNFAQGLCDGYLHRLGIGMGTTMAMNSGVQPHRISGGTNPRGRFGAVHPSQRPAPLTQSEIAALVQQRMAA